MNIAIMKGYEITFKFKIANRTSMTGVKEIYMQGIFMSNLGDQINMFSKYRIYILLKTVYITAKIIRLDNISCVTLVPTTYFQNNEIS